MCQFPGQYVGTGTQTLSTNADETAQFPVATMSHMSLSEEQGNRWQFSLRMIFGLVTLSGVGIWLLQQGSVGLFIGFLVTPLYVALVLELAGYREVAKAAAMAITLFWLLSLLGQIFGIGV